MYFREAGKYKIPNQRGTRRSEVGIRYCIHMDRSYGVGFAIPSRSSQHVCFVEMIPSG